MAEEKSKTEEKPKELQEQTPKYKTLAKLQAAMQEKKEGVNVSYTYAEPSGDLLLFVNRARGRAPQNLELLFRCAADEFVSPALTALGFKPKHVED